MVRFSIVTLFPELFTTFAATSMVGRAVRTQAIALELRARGADTLLAIEREPERLRCIKGITAQRAKELSDAFRALTGLRQLMEFLARYDLPVYLAMPLQRTYGDGAIQALRDIRASAVARGATQMRGLNHGNALSIYFADPEGNTVEVYVDTPFYVAQPHGDPLDLEKSDAEILAETEAICRADPTFMPLDQWQAQFLSKAPSA